MDDTAHLNGTAYATVSGREHHIPPSVISFENGCKEEWAGRGASTFRGRAAQDPGDKVGARVYTSSAADR